MRLVLDTNVIVSALFWKGNERRVLLACLAGDHMLVTSPSLLAEARRVIVEKFSYPRNEAGAYLDLIMRAGEVVEPPNELHVVAEDPDDNRVLECAVEGRADAIVTGDRHLLKLGTFRRIAILRAKDIPR